MCMSDNWGILSAIQQTAVISTLQLEITAAILSLFTINHDYLQHVGNAFRRCYILVLSARVLRSKRNERCL